MKKDAIIYFGKITILILLIFCFSNCKNNQTEEPAPDDLALVNSNMELVNTNKIPDLYYGVDARFSPIKKSDIHKATTIYDFLNAGEKEQIAHINSVKLVIIKNNQQSDIQAYGDSDQLTDEQLNILRSTDYFSHFTIKTQFKEKNKENGKMEERFFGPHITVVPDKQATYNDGHEALINYLKENSKESMNVIKGDNLGAIKLSFIVTKEGTIAHVKHDAMTTGYASIDQKLKELIKNIPGEWTPAENAQGEKMDYEFVFTFGLRDGC
ncbi:hypothetical protein WNY78_06015 [Psychroserpens sp. AS72]|uniref:hypothetical protein n=1 Tax=Psychroserpens sp. AS72 TaxID=3135775 RepID=UPI003175BA06